jgi:hypothetical protein
MPTHELHAIFFRLGLALSAGVLIACVPIAYRKAKFASHKGARIAGYSVAALALAAFLAMGWHLWSRYVPPSAETPEPITYPAAPVLP